MKLIIVDWSLIDPSDANNDKDLSSSCMRLLKEVENKGNKVVFLSNMLQINGWQGVAEIYLRNQLNPLIESQLEKAYDEIVVFSKKVDSKLTKSIYLLSDLEIFEQYLKTLLKPQERQDNALTGNAGLPLLETSRLEKLDNGVKDEEWVNVSIPEKKLFVISGNTEGIENNFVSFFHAILCRCAEGHKFILNLDGIKSEDIKRFLRNLSALDPVKIKIMDPNANLENTIHVSSLSDCFEVGRDQAINIDGSNIGLILEDLAKAFPEKKSDWRNYLAIFVSAIFSLISVTSNFVLSGTFFINAIRAIAAYINESSNLNEEALSDAKLGFAIDSGYVNWTINGESGYLTIFLLGSLLANVFSKEATAKARGINSLLILFYLFSAGLATVPQWDINWTSFNNEDVVKLIYKFAPDPAAIMFFAVVATVFSGALCVKGVKLGLEFIVDAYEAAKDKYYGGKISGLAEFVRMALLAQMNSLRSQELPDRNLRFLSQGWLYICNHPKIAIALKVILPAWPAEYIREAYYYSAYSAMNDIDNKSIFNMLTSGASGLVRYALLAKTNFGVALTWIASLLSTPVFPLKKVSSVKTWYNRSLNAFSGIAFVGSLAGPLGLVMKYYYNNIYTLRNIIFSGLSVTPSVLINLDSNRKMAFKLCDTLIEEAYGMYLSLLDWLNESDIDHREKAKLKKRLGEDFDEFMEKCMAQLASQSDPKVVATYVNVTDKLRIPPADLEFAKTSFEQNKDPLNPALPKYEVTSEFRKHLEKLLLLRLDHENLPRHYEEMIRKKAARVIPTKQPTVGNKNATEKTSLLTPVGSEQTNSSSWRGSCGSIWYRGLNKVRGCLGSLCDREPDKSAAFYAEINNSF